MNEPAVKYNDENFGATITEYEGGLYLLEWTDYVANDWQEVLPTLGAAQRRLAELIDVVSRDEMLSDLDDFLAKERRGTP